MEKHEILLVDDDPGVLEVMGWALEDQGCRVTPAPDGEAALELLNEKRFDLVITDLNLGPLDGLTILKRVKERQPETRVMICTGNTGVTSFIDAFRSGVDDYILKPPDLTQFRDRVDRCLRKTCPPEMQTSSQPDFSLPDQYILHKVETMTHEFRASLVSISSTLRLLNRGFFGAMEERVAEKLRELLAKVTHLSGLAEDYLGKGLSMDGNVDGEVELLDLRKDVINPVLEELSSEIQDHQALIENRLGMNSINGIRVKASRIWLKSVFRHLLKNAIAYGDKGCTIVFGLENHGSHVRLNVFNTGKTIPQEYREQLFNKCIRIGEGNSREPERLGLGLYFTKKILQRQGGDISYEPKDNGSNFVVTLPGS
jgi:DNA-binding response OmpR family regulator